METSDFLLAGILFCLGSIQLLALSLRQTDKENIEKQRLQDAAAIAKLFELDRDRSKELVLAVKQLSETVACLRADMQNHYALREDLEKHKDEGHKRYSGLREDVVDVSGKIANINRYGCDMKGGAC